MLNNSKFSEVKSEGRNCDFSLERLRPGDWVFAGRRCEASCAMTWSILPMLGGCTSGSSVESSGNLWVVCLWKNQQTHVTLCLFHSRSRIYSLWDQLDVVIVADCILAVVDLLLTTIQNLEIRFQLAIHERRPGAWALRAVSSVSLDRTLATAFRLCALLDLLVLDIAAVDQSLVGQASLEGRFDLVLVHQFVKFLLVLAVVKLNLDFSWAVCRYICVTVLDYNLWRVRHLDLGEKISIVKSKRSFDECTNHKLWIHLRNSTSPSIQSMFW